MLWRYLCYGIQVFLFFEVAGYINYTGKYWIVRQDLAASTNFGYETVQNCINLGSACAGFSGDGTLYHQATKCQAEFLLYTSQDASVVESTCHQLTNAAVDYTINGTKFYNLQTNCTTASSCATMCANMGLSEISIHSATENAAIRGNVSATTSCGQIGGANQLVHLAITKSAKNLSIWADGTPFDYNYAAFNNSWKTSCVGAVMAANGTWTPTGCAGDTNTYMAACVCLKRPANYAG